jgi:hypothetical protein
MRQELSGGNSPRFAEERVVLAMVYMWDVGVGVPARNCWNKVRLGWGIVQDRNSVAGSMLYLRYSAMDREKLSGSREVTRRVAEWRTWNPGVVEGSSGVL